MSSNVQKKLDALCKFYTKNLPNKIQDLENLWKKQQQHWDLIEFQDFYREVHGLCGSAGTYGYPELSTAARTMEVFLKTLLNKDSISIDDQERITIYLKQLHSAFKIEQEKNVPLLEHVEPVENKCVYIMERDELLLQQLMESLKQIGYSPYPIKDIITLQVEVKDNPPIAMIIDTHYLDKQAIQEIINLQKNQAIPIQLFCIVPNSELLPRLEAIRIGCQAFFQKPVDVMNLTQLLNYKCSIIPGEAYRILIIDDSESLGEYYSLILNQAGMITRAISNPMELLTELESFQPHLLLMDVYMPECTGFELAAVLRQENIYTKIPIIFLSTEDNSNTKLFAISIGGDDFLTKPVSPQHLISAVRSRSKRAHILNYYMTTDSLTGLLNHSSILKQLDIHLAQAKLANIPLSFIMIDIDHFKKINDSFGHPVGDVVIKKLSSLFLARLRSQDSVGRYGGEEFAIILPGTNVEESKKIVNALLLQFSKFSFKADTSKFFATFSAGISSFNGKNDATSIIMQADQALYKAKEMGRNQIVVFNQ